MPRRAHLHMLPFSFIFRRIARALCSSCSICSCSICSCFNSNHTTNQKKVIQFFDKFQIPNSKKNLSLKHNAYPNKPLHNNMPYTLRKQSRRGYKVCKKGTRKCFSKRALTKRMAIRQMRALYLNERNSKPQSKKQSGG